MKEIFISFIIEKVSKMLFLSCSTLTTIVGITLPNFDLEKRILEEMPVIIKEEKTEADEEIKQDVANVEVLESKKSVGEVLEEKNDEELKETIEEDAIVTIDPKVEEQEEVAKMGNASEKEEETSKENENVYIEDKDREVEVKEEALEEEKAILEKEKVQNKAEKKTETLKVEEKKEPASKEEKPNNKFEEPVFEQNKFEEKEEPKKEVPTVKEEIVEEVKDKEQIVEKETSENKDATTNEVEEPKVEQEEVIEQENSNEKEEETSKENDSLDAENKDREVEVKEETKEETVLEKEKLEEKVEENNETLKVEEKKETSSKEEKPNNKFEEPVFEQNKFEEKEEPKKEEIPTVKEEVAEEVKEEEQIVEKETSENKDANTNEVEEPKVEQEKVFPEVQDVNEEDELITLIKNAKQRTANVNSAHFTRYRTGLYPGSEEIKYNKNQNRFLYVSSNIQEYLEGAEGNYPPTVNGRVSSYYAQTRWKKDAENPNWVKQSPLISYFGISELGFLNEIKSVKKVEGSGYRLPLYEVTLAQDFANQAGENLLNTVNLFNKDVKVYVTLDLNYKYIIKFDCKFEKEDLNKKELGPIEIDVHIGGFDSTNIARPSDLNDEPDEREKPSDALTQNQKAEIMNKIYNAYTKTYNANSATYELNGQKVMYNKSTNSALMETSTETTYYKGQDGMYLDYDFVKPKYHHESWTKLNGSSEWKQNVTKHKKFIPQELLFLNHDYIVIHDVEEVETVGDVNTYTITILQYGANLIYSEIYETENKFNANVTFKVSIDKNGYVVGINADFGDNKIALKLYDIDNTEVVKPAGIE